MPRWGEFQKDGRSRYGFRQYSAILWDIPWGQSWERTCSNMPATVRGHTFRRPSRCVKTLTHMWGQFDVPDTTFLLPPSYGIFSGDVIARFLPNGRDMELLQDFHYIDPHGIKWTAPRGYITDGASIPQSLWSTVGGPFSGKYRSAAVVHDYACSRRLKPWRDVHWMFHEAMLAAGVERSQADNMFNGVWAQGPKW